MHLLISSVAWFSSFFFSYFRFVQLIFYWMGNVSNWLLNWSKSLIESNLKQRICNDVLRWFISWTLLCFFAITSSDSRNYCWREKKRGKNMKLINELLVTSFVRIAHRVRNKKKTSRHVCTWKRNCKMQQRMRENKFGCWYIQQSNRHKHIKQTNKNHFLRYSRKIKSTEEVKT